MMEGTPHTEYPFVAIGKCMGTDRPRDGKVEFMVKVSFLSLHLLSFLHLYIIHRQQRR